LNPDGARWWDGDGGSGGKTKPKFFYAHNLIDSTITNLHIENTPIQAVSINGCDGLTVTSMTIDNTAGDTGGGKNTDGFDIGSSSSVTITGANVYNQDDCVAINSGTVSSYPFICFNASFISLSNEFFRISRLRMAFAPVDMAFLSALSVAVTIIQLIPSHSAILRLRTR